MAESRHEDGNARTGFSRRGFLAAVGPFAAAGYAWPERLAAWVDRVPSQEGPADEAFWRMVRAQFSIAADRIYLNNGTLGPQPRSVMDAVEEHGRRVAATLPPGVDWDGLKVGLGELLGADPAGFVFPRNTTEAMSFVAHGLDLEPGDEVVTTDHEHIGGVSAWELLAERRRLRLRRARLPVPAASSDELLGAVWSEVGPRTRVVSVSHVTFTNGTTLPVAELGDRCRERGIVFAVDGAHPPGMMAVDLGAVRPDFYASSPHKWLLAPQGTGLLWLGAEWRERLWPTLASGGWDDLELGAHRLNHMGTLDESRFAGLAAAVAFHAGLGVDRVEARVRDLHARLRAGLEAVPGVRIVTPEGPSLSSGMLSFEVEGVPSLDLQRHLARAANVRSRVIGEYDLGWMRLSTHVYNRPSELDAVIERVDEVARRGLPGGYRP